MFTVLKTCGRCNELVDFAFRVVFDHTQRTSEEVQELRRTDNPKFLNRPISGTVRREDKITASALCHCPRCLGPTLIVFQISRTGYATIKELIGTDDGFMVGGVDIIEIHPKPTEPEVSPHWPQEIVRKFAEAQKFLDQKISPSTILSVCRTVLDVSTRLLSEENEKLYSRIESLQKKGIITKPIRDWAHELRLDGNTAIHEGDGEESYAREYIDFLRMFLNMTFHLPRRIEELRQTKGLNE